MKNQVATEINTSPAGTREELGNHEEAAKDAAQEDRDGGFERRQGGWTWRGKWKFPGEVRAVRGGTVLGHGGADFPLDAGHKPSFGNHDTL